MPVKNRKKSQKKADDPIPLIRPSEVLSGGTPRSKAPPSKPLVSLNEDDLRAAGVTFTETGAPRIPGLPVQLTERDGEVVWEKEEVPRPSGRRKREGRGEATVRELQDGEEEEEVWDSSDEEGFLEEEGEEEEEAAISAWWDEFFDSMLYTVPFSFLYLMLDM